MNIYPERLLVVKDDSSEEQDHYLLIVDKEGNQGSMGKTKWYPIKNGKLTVSIPTLSLHTVFSQKERYGETETVRDKTEYLRGRGQLTRGSYNTYAVGLSHFGSTRIHQDIDVRIDRFSEEKEHCYVGGLKSSIDFTLRIGEEFFLSLYLNERRYAELVDQISQGNMHECEIVVDISGLSGFYSEWGRLEGNTFGHIKYFDYENKKHILNAEEFEDDFVKKTFEKRGDDLKSYLFDLTIVDRTSKDARPDLDNGEDSSDEENDAEASDFEEDDQHSFEKVTLELRTEELKIQAQKLSVLRGISNLIAVFGIGLLVVLWFG